MRVKALSNQVTDEELTEGRIYPNLKRIRGVSFRIAYEVSKYALQSGLCNENVKAETLAEILKQNVYNSNYDA